MKSEKGEDAERILFGSILSNDPHAGTGFDYLIANAPISVGFGGNSGSRTAEKVGIAGRNAVISWRPVWGGR